jgi:TrmH family RNA methyltransferase
VCVLEGPDLVEAALDADQELEAVYCDAEDGDDLRSRALAERARARGVRCFDLAPGVMARVADAQTPQPILATARFALLDPTAAPFNRLILVLHDVRDPGNAGTVIRSADAAGAGGVVFTGQSVDPYNPKTLRATAGSIFNIAVMVGEFSSVVGDLRARGVAVWAAVVRGGTDYAAASLAGPVAVVFGNESEGLDPREIALCDERLTIPMVGRSESLNLGVAASLVAFEAMRQRGVPDAQSPRPSLGGL